MTQGGLADTRNLTDTEIPLLNKEHPALSVLSGGAGYFYV